MQHVFQKPEFFRQEFNEDEYYARLEFAGGRMVEELHGYRFGGFPFGEDR
jgi:hypothetical protein